MQSIDQLLDSVKTKHGLTSDYKLAQHLGLTMGAIAHYRHGRSLPDDRACQKIGDALGIDGDVLAAQMLARRAKDDDSRAMWNRIANRLSGAVAGVSMATGVAIDSKAGSPGTATAAAASPAAGDGGLYIMSSRRWREVFARLAKTLAGTPASGFSLA